MIVVEPGVQEACKTNSIWGAGHGARVLLLRVLARSLSYPAYWTCLRDACLACRACTASNPVKKGDVAKRSRVSDRSSWGYSAGYAVHLVQPRAHL